jgi:hypothetical protein
METEKHGILLCVWLKTGGSERIYLFTVKVKTFGRMEKAERRYKSERQIYIKTK